MENFKYADLDLDCPSVRLVMLHAGRLGDDIQCSIFEAQFDRQDEMMPYEALSYTWGGSSKPADIVVDECRLHVTSNLFNALQHIRREYEDRILWIDAISINQANVHERNHQVRQMKRIYENAENVLVWLGNGSEYTNYTMDYLAWMYEMEARGKILREIHKKVTWGASFYAIRELYPAAHPDHPRLIRAGLHELLNSPWFERIWILQEIGSARAASVFCGSRSIRSKAFCRTLRYPDEFPMSDHCRTVLDVMPASRRLNTWWNESRDLKTLLSKFKRSKASDERDRIYALFGLATDSNREDFPTIDYARSIEQLISDVTRYLLHIGSNQTIKSIHGWTVDQFISQLDTLAKSTVRRALALRYSDDLQMLQQRYGKALSLKSTLSRTIETTSAFFLEHAENIISKFEPEGDTRLVESGEMCKALERLIEVPKSPPVMETWSRLGMRPALLAILMGSLPILKCLRDLPTFIPGYQHPSSARTLLSYASEHGHEEIVRFLINLPEADICTHDNRERSPLHYAILGGHERVLTLLLEDMRIPVDLRDRDGYTLLFHAIHADNGLAVIRLLGNGRIDPGEKCHGSSPLEFARSLGRKRVCRVLEDRRWIHGFFPRDSSSLD